MGWAEDVVANREAWATYNAEWTGPEAPRKWAQEQITWGTWDISESELCVVGDVDGLDVVELGCGTAFVSAWLARLGAKPVGVDISPEQLATARQMMAKTGLAFPLVEADAGDTGLPSGSFDLAISASGASLWVDPARWLPEAARLLRPGGRLVFTCGSPLAALCSGADGLDKTLHLPLFGLYRNEWGKGTVEFELPHGVMIDALSAAGFRVERLIELQAPEGAETNPRLAWVTAEWGRKWPVDDVWVTRKG